MSSSALTPFSYAVLVLVGRGGAGPHDLVRMARQGRVYWEAADSQWYAEPKRLEALGLLSARKEPGRTRDRTHYELTDAGLAAIADWMTKPARWPRIQHEAVVRLLAVDLVPAADVLTSLLGLREQLDDLDRRIDRGEEVAASLPHREAVLRLNHRLAREIVAAHRRWLLEVERELGSGA
jgi:PadR family transcriptional regulator, regulatory protein AphA